MAELAANQDPKAMHGGSMLARLAGIGVLLLGVVGAFLYLGGWFSPHELTPARFVDEFQRVDGRTRVSAGITRRAFASGDSSIAMARGRASRRPLCSGAAACR